MIWKRVIQRIIIFLVFEQNVSSLTMHTEDVVTILQEDNSIILNCTYDKNSKEDIAKRNIRWQKQINGGFEDIALFSPPGKQEPFIVKEKHPWYNNRTILIAPNTSMAAVMIIKDPVCSDEGIYQCRIKYYSDSSVKTKTTITIVGFAAKKPEEFSMSSNELEENQSISLTCHADVGSPQGYVQILKIPQYPNTPEVIYTSNTTNIRTENCTEYINVTTTYTVTREDNGAMFLCSSQNGLTPGLGPNRELSKITVIYGPGIPAVTIKLSKSVNYVGDSLTIECSADSNPPPVFTWSFLFENKSEEQIELPHHKSSLTFKSLHPTDSGTYTCTATNTARTKYSNTNSVSVLVRISKEMSISCDHCGNTKICQHNNGRNECVFNIWIFIAFVFIITSVIFAVIFIILRRIPQKSTETNDKLNIERRSHPYNDTSQEDNGGVYSSPTDLNRMHKASLEDTNVAYSTTKDEIRMQKNVLLLPDKNEPDVHNN
ncbi:neurotrimin-like isoform X3 [Magallana gigas]|uniref:neurotrimin-like isoform X3 n=1 Tax=Magallana gigas TaxID=29159 RepID=UPI003341C2DE